MHSHVETKNNHYENLNVSKKATRDQIHTAFLKLAMENHPDKNPNAEEKFKAINAAYKVLSDPKNRKEYDNSIQEKITGLSFKIFLDEKKTKTPSTALVATQSYNFFEVLNTASLSGGELVTVGENSLDAAIEIMKYSKFRDQLKPFHLYKLGVKYQSIALTIISDEMLSWENDRSRIINLAKIHWQVCEYLMRQRYFQEKLDITNLDYLLESHGNKLRTLCQETDELIDFYNATQDLSSYVKKPKKKVENLEEFKKNINLSKVGAKYLKMLAEKNASVNSLIQTNADLNLILNPLEEKIEEEFSLSSYALESLEQCLNVLEDPVKLEHVGTILVMRILEKYKSAAINFLEMERFNFLLNGEDFLKLAAIDKVFATFIENNANLKRCKDAYSILLNYKKNTLSYDQLNSYYEESRILAIHMGQLAAKNKDLALEWLIHDVGKYISFFYDAIISFEEVANLVFERSNYFQYFKMQQLSNIVYKYKVPCINFLKYTNYSLNGGAIVLLIEKWGDEVSAIVFQRPQWQQTLQAYQLLKRATESSISLSEATTSQVSEDNAELLYEMGRRFLKSDSADKYNIAANYFTQSASKDYEKACNALIRFEGKFNKKYLFSIAELYADSALSFCDKAKAETYYRYGLAEYDQRAFPKLIQILFNQVSLEKPLSLNLNYIALETFFINAPLSEKDRGDLARPLVEICQAAGNLSKELFYSKHLKHVSQEELYRIAHLMLAEIEAQQKVKIIKNRPDIATEEMSNLLNQPVHIAERINNGLPNLINFANQCQDNDIKNHCVIPLLIQLNQTKLVSREVAVLVNQDFQLSESLDEACYFEICYAHPEIFINMDLSLVAAKCIATGEDLFNLAEKCYEQASGKFNIAAYLFWFASACKGYQPAVEILNIFHSNMLVTEENNFVNQLENDHKKISDSLEDESEFFVEKSYDNIKNTLIHYLKQSHKDTLDISITHYYAVRGDVDKLAEVSNTYSFSNLDYSNSNVLQRLNEYHPDKIFTLYELVKNDKNKLRNFYQALLLLIVNTKEPSNTISTLLNHIIPETMHSSTMPISLLLSDALVKCVQLNNVKVALLLLDQVDPMKHIELISLVSKKFINTGSLSIFTNDLSVQMRNLLAIKKKESEFYWSEFLNTIIKGLSTHKFSIFNKSSTVAGCKEFCAKLTLLKNNLEEEPETTFQTCLQTYVNTLTQNKAKSEIILINNLLNHANEKILAIQETPKFRGS